MNDFIEKVIEAADSNPWIVPMAMHSRLVPHIMRTRGLSFRDASIMVEVPFKSVQEAMDDNLPVSQLKKILETNLKSYFKD